MKLNPDCIRDLLLYLEDNLVIVNRNTFSEITLEQLKQKFLEFYSEDDIFYSIYNLHKIRFIDGKINDVSDMKMFYCEIQNITWSGHQFINTVRPKSIWDATKNGAYKLGITSISALSSIAMSVSNAVITNPTVIHKIVDKIQF